MAFNVLRAASHVCTAQDPGKNLGAKEALKKGTSIIIIIMNAHYYYTHTQSEYTEVTKVYDYHRKHKTCWRLNGLIKSLQP